jgi:hypothetical protein
MTGDMLLVPWEYFKYKGTKRSNLPGLAEKQAAISYNHFELSFLWEAVACLVATKVGRFPGLQQITHTIKTSTGIRPNRHDHPFFGNLQRPDLPQLPRPELLRNIDQFVFRYEKAGRKEWDNRPYLCRCETYTVISPSELTWPHSSNNNAQKEAKEAENALVM